jgi:hypothetical protein
MLRKATYKVTSQEMAKLLISQSSDPAFFGLNENGEEII